MALVNRIGWLHERRNGPGQLRLSKTQGDGKNFKELVTVHSGQADFLLGQTKDEGTGLKVDSLLIVEDASLTAAVVRMAEVFDLLPDAGEPRRYRKRAKPEYVGAERRWIVTLTADFGDETPVDPAEAP